MEPIYARFLYRKVGDNFSTVFNGPARNTTEGHDAVIAAWNEVARGRIVWEWQEIRETDYDYPKEP